MPDQFVVHAKNFFDSDESGAEGSAASFRVIVWRRSAVTVWRSVSWFHVNARGTI